MYCTNLSMNVDKSYKTKSHFNISDYRNSSSSYLPNQQNNTILNSSNISTNIHTVDSNNQSYNNQNFSNNNNDFVENNNFNNNSFINTTVDNYSNNQNSRYNRGKRIPVEEDINYFNSNNSNSNFEESTSNSGQSKKIKIEQFVDTARKEYSGSYSYDNLASYKIKYNNKTNNLQHPHSQTTFNSQSLPTNYSSSSSNNNPITTDINRHPLSNSENQLSTSYYSNPSYKTDNTNSNSTSSHNNTISINNNSQNNSSINNSYNNPNIINSGYSHPQYQHSTNLQTDHQSLHNNQNLIQPLHSANMTPSIQTTESSGDSFQMSVKRKSLSIMSIDNITNNNEEYQQKEVKKANNSDNYLTKNSNSTPSSISKPPITSNGHGPHHDTIKSVTNHNSQRDATSRNSNNTEDTNNTTTTNNATTNDPTNPTTNRPTTTTPTNIIKISSTVVKKLNSSSSLSISKSKSNNTNSCIYLPRNFYEVEMSHLIYLIAEMLEKLTKYNDQITLTKENLTRFHSRKAPDISIYDYLKRIVKYAAIDKVALLSLLIYIDRICKRHRMFTISSLTVHRFIITSLTCASKAMCDSICTNTHYSRGIIKKFYFKCFFFFIDKNIYI